jgi:hypothetical protein
MRTIKKIFRLIFKTIKWTLFIIIGLVIVSALYNLTLPKKSRTVEHLSIKEKSFIAEAMNLQKKMGNEVWPGWGDTLIPVIVYNEKYAFLIGYPNPPQGWLKMPNREVRGTKWEAVNSDDFFGATYYRQSLPNPEITPENFTVMVGDRWVATIQTKEYAAIAFYNGFRSQLPPVLNAIFPYKIFWTALMGIADKYIGVITHEAFHAFQGTQVPQRLAEAERVANLENNYPWHKPENANGWTKEINSLIESFKAESNESARILVAQFLDERNERREKSNLSVEIINYEQNREWLEGLAKYAELTIGLKALQNENYKNVKAIESFSEFKKYKTFAKYYRQQIEEVRRSATRPNENRFYYSGMLQAVMLDQLMPDWKKEAFGEDVYLDNLLRSALNK